MTQPSVARLKELLFEKESRDLDAIARRLEPVAERAGSDADLRRSVARVLEGALRDAEKAQHQELSGALAPMVRRTFRAEIRSEAVQDELAGALYPKIGDMIRRYVASAMRDLMDTINRRLESGLTQNRLALKLRSLATGRSMAELALADTQPFAVEELYLIRRGSGELVHHWSREAAGGTVSPGGAGGNRDSLVSGFLTAITAFAEEAFAGNRDSLRALDLDSHRIYLRASPSYLLAAKCSGTAEAAIEQVLDKGLIDILAEHRAVEAKLPADGGDTAVAEARRQHEAILLQVSGRIEEEIGAAAAQIRRSRGMRPLKAAFLLIGLPLAAYIGYEAYTGYWTTHLQRAVNASIAAMPEFGGYPVTARVERGARTIYVNGLAPTHAARARLIATIETTAPGAALVQTVGVLPSVDLADALASETRRRAADQAVGRLRILDGELRTALGKDGAGQEILGAARKDIDGAIEIISALQAQSAPDRLRAEHAGQALAEVQGRLEGATAHIAGMIDASPAPQPAATRAAAATLVEHLDRLTETAERMSTAVVLLEQQQRAAEARAREVAPLLARQAELTREVAELSRRLEAARTEPSPRQKLEAFARSTAIFFSNGSEYRDPAQAGAALDEAAQLIQAAGLLVRIVGYTDEAGTAAQNLPLSQSRADKVEGDLAARGVPRQLLVAVGRATVLELQPRSGTANASRRVEIEIAFRGERPGAP